MRRPPIPILDPSAKTIEEEIYDVDLRTKGRGLRSISGCGLRSWPFRCSRRPTPRTGGTRTSRRRENLRRARTGGFGIDNHSSKYLDASAPFLAIIGRSAVAAKSGVPMCDDALYFVGADGKKITLAQLPPPGLKRWRPHHKAILVAAVRHGLITVDEVCKRYNLPIERYLSWHRIYAPQPSDDRN